MKHILTVLYISLFLSTLNGQQVSNSIVHFNFDSAELTYESRKELNNILHELNNEFHYNLKIIGHTDQDGNNQYNDALATRRAETVFDYLIENGASLDNTHYISKGEYDLLYDTSDDFSKAQNRRVEIRIEKFVLETIQDVLDIINPQSKVQEFILLGNQPHLITGKEGTIVEIPANAFIFEDGSSPKGPIVIQLIEAFDYSSIIQHNLSCKSEDQLLETGGMINVIAKSEDQLLTLKEDKSIQLTFPLSEIKEDMELFYGDLESEDGVSNWVPADQPIQQKVEKIDQELLDFIDLNSLVLKRLEPKAPVFDLPKIPAKPKIPGQAYKPYKPIEPIKEKITVRFSWKEKLLWSQKVKEEKIEEAYQKKYAQYLKNMQEYEIKLARYETRKKRYKQDVIDAKKAIVEWEKEMETLRYELGHYYLKLDVYRTEKMIFDAQEYLLQHVSKENKLEVLEQYNVLLHEKKISYYHPVARRYYKTLFANKRMSCLTYKTNRRYKDGHMFIVDKDLEDKINATRHILKGPQRIIEEAKFAQNPGEKTIQELGRYVTAISSLGWINCDRFKAIAAENKRVLAFTAEPNTTYYMAFNNINSILTPVKSGDQFIFTGVPKGEDVTIIGIQLKDQTPHLYVQDMKIVDNQHIKTSFEKVTYKKMSETFKQLNT